jgi:hypothetical protein
VTATDCTATDCEVAHSPSTEAARVPVDQRMRVLLCGWRSKT